MQITINDDEENTRPSKSKLPSKVEEETGNILQKGLIWIIIPDKEEDENPLQKDANCCASANEGKTDSHVSSSP